MCATSASNEKELPSLWEEPGMGLERKKTQLIILSMHTNKRIQRKLIHLVSYGSEFIEKIFQTAN